MCFLQEKSKYIFEINLTLLLYEILEKLVTYITLKVNKVFDKGLINKKSLQEVKNGIIALSESHSNKQTIGNL